jgi:hypothetical protein
MEIIHLVQHINLITKNEIFLKPQRGDILVAATLYFEETKPCKGDI